MRRGDSPAFIVGLTQPGYLRVGACIRWDTMQQKATGAGGLYTPFNLQRKSVGFMLLKEKVDQSKTCELSQLVVPHDRTWSESDNEKHVTSNAIAA